MTLFHLFRRLYIFLRKLWKCSCCCHNASCQTIAVQCLRCSEKFLFYLYVVARVFWVVARWLLSNQVKTTQSWVSVIFWALDIAWVALLIETYNCFAHFIVQLAEIVSLIAKSNCTVIAYSNCTWKVIALCLQQIPQLFVSVVHEDLHTKV